MDNAIRIGLSQQVALKRQLATVANNLANMNTAGFKNENLVFEEYIMPVASMANHNASSNQLSYVSDTGLTRDFTAGSPEGTGNPLDIALNSKGWFTVQTPEGERYTRDGHFSLNAEGQMVTLSGLPVMVDGAPLNFSANETDIAIAEDGTISTNQGVRGQLQISSFNDERVLQKEGGNLFSTEALPQAADNISVTQGSIEKSNVNPIVQMTKMIEIQRAYERTASMLEKMAQLKTQSINKLSQVA